MFGLTLDFIKCTGTIIVFAIPLIFKYIIEDNAITWLIRENDDKYYDIDYKTKRLTVQLIKSTCFGFFVPLIIALLTVSIVGIYFPLVSISNVMMCICTIISILILVRQIKKYIHNKVFILMPFLYNLLFSLMYTFMLMTIDDTENVNINRRLVLFKLELTSDFIKYTSLVCLALVLIWIVYELYLTLKSWRLYNACKNNIYISIFTKELSKEVSFERIPINNVREGFGKVIIMKDKKVYNIPSALIITKEYVYITQDEGYSMMADPNILKSI